MAVTSKREDLLYASILLYQTNRTLILEFGTGDFFPLTGNFVKNLAKIFY